MPLAAPFKASSSPGQATETTDFNGFGRTTPIFISEVVKITSRAYLDTNIYTHIYHILKKNVKTLISKFIFIK